MCIVTFDVAAFKVRYPEFAALSEPLLTAYFNESTLYLDNTDCSIVQCCTTRAMYLNMLTAHIASLNKPADANGAGGSSPLVGRINSATEGTVSVSAAMDGVPGTAAWFMQTKYGAAYWQATAQYRTMRYMANRSYPAPPQPNFGPFFGGARWRR